MIVSNQKCVMYIQLFLLYVEISVKLNKCFSLKSFALLFSTQISYRLMLYISWFIHRFQISFTSVSKLY